MLRRSSEPDHALAKFARGSLREGLYLFKAHRGLALFSAQRKAPPADSLVDAKILNSPAQSNDVSTLNALAQLHAGLVDSLETRVFGQRQAIELMLTTLFAGGHALLVGVPGLGKTRLVQSLAQALDLTFSRIQFTPDLMPADVTGSEILDEDPATRQRTFRFVPGPVFCNLLLADEINRTPPKTQSALLEAMQEGQVSVGGQPHQLGTPFCVFATRNPIEQEGTYPLPEAQLDRFMLQICIDYPDAQAERSIITLSADADLAPLKPQIHAADLLQYQALVRRVPVPDTVVDAVVNLLQNTRPSHPQSPDFVKKHVQLGAGPRAGQLLVRAAQARAALSGHAAVRLDDIAALASPILEHRLILAYGAGAEGIHTGEIVQQLVDRMGHLR